MVHQLWCTWGKQKEVKPADIEDICMLQSNTCVGASLPVNADPFSPYQTNCISNLKVHLCIKKRKRCTETLSDCRTKITFDQRDHSKQPHRYLHTKAKTSQLFHQIHLPWKKKQKKKFAWLTCFDPVWSSIIEEMKPLAEGFALYFKSTWIERPNKTYSSILASLSARSLPRFQISTPCPSPSRVLMQA